MKSKTSQVVLPEHTAKNLCNIANEVLCLKLPAFLKEERARIARLHSQEKLKLQLSLPLGMRTDIINQAAIDRFDPV